MFLFMVMLKIIATMVISLGFPDLCMLLSTREFTISLTQFERGHICVLRMFGSEMLIVGFS